MKQKRTFKKEEKLAILKEASEHGVKVTLDKHGIYPSTYYSWRNELKEMGDIGLDHGVNKQHLSIPPTNHILPNLIIVPTFG